MAKTSRSTSNREPWRPTARRDEILWPGNWPRPAADGACTRPPAHSRANASYLDTLAAAFAEAGDFAKAVTVQKEAIALLRSEKEIQDYASRLKLYESNTPYHENQ